VPVIRIDEEVWQWLQGQAEPLVDNPNSVLRRVAGLDADQEKTAEHAAAKVFGALATQLEPGTSGSADARRRSEGSLAIPPRGGFGRRRTQSRGRELVENLRSELERCAPEGATRTWEGGRRRTRNILHVGPAPDAKLVYAKVRTEAPGFWGLNENQLASLRTSGLPWFVVLIEGSSGTHHLLSSSQVENAIRAGTWTMSNSDYKVHENDRELVGALGLDSAAAAAEHIVNRV